MLSVYGRGKNGLFSSRITATFLASCFVVSLSQNLQAAEGGGTGFCLDSFCSSTARAAFKACRYEFGDDFWIEVGKCNNLADFEARIDCLQEVRSSFAEERGVCGDQLDARLDICDELGEAPYDPEINPDDFIDFSAVVGGGGYTPNPYFPLVPGTVWNYEAVDAEGEIFEKIKVEVLLETKEILGVNCIVVRDRVWEIDDEGEEVLIEDTDDWYAQDSEAGNVWYFGEVARNFEDGELVDLEGSWKAGREGDKAGILVYGEPEPNHMHRQEFSLGNAEDMAQVVGFLDSLTVRSTTYNDVLQTREFTPIEPDVMEFKYYAPGIGTVLEENPEDGERVELVEMITP